MSLLHYSLSNNQPWDMEVIGIHETEVRDKSHILWLVVEYVFNSIERQSHQNKRLKGLAMRYWNLFNGYQPIG